MERSRNSWRILGLFQRREDAAEAAADLEAQGRAVRVSDGGYIEDAAAFGRVLRGLASGAAIGVIAGIVVGLVVMRWTGAWPAVMAIAAVALGAFGAIAGSQFGAAAAEASRSSGQSLAVTTETPPEEAAQVERTLRDHGAATVEDENRLRSRTRPRLG